MNEKRQTLLAFLAVAAMLLMGQQASYAQQLTGVLTGIVSDTTQAVIPNATVVLTNEQSRDTRRTVTNNEGFFGISGVFAGAYTVSVEAPGFAKWERTGIVMNPGDRRSINDISLQVGAATEQIVVSGEAASLTPVDSGEKAVVINQRQLQNIAVVGRSAAEFVKILPGMSATGSGLENRPGFSGEVIGINGNGDGGKQSALGTFSANGTRPEAVDIVGDGAHVSDPGCNCATPVNPNTDMVQEFKVLQSNFSAENAKGPVVMNFVTKSGGRDFHGMGYVYARHFAMNSNDALFKLRGQERPENQFYFPGGNIGGPVIIPGANFNRNRDKLFFFTGFEYYKQKLDTGVLQAQVPTDRMLAGDFTESNILNAFGQASGQANTVPSTAVNGVIPQNQLDPGGLALARLLPKPNIDPASPQGAGFNYVNALSLDQNSWQLVNRVDYSISDMTKLFVRYNVQTELQQFPVQLWWRNANAVPLPTPIDGKNRSDSISTSLTHVFSPTLTNEFVFGYTFVDFPNSYRDIDKLDRAAVGYPYGDVFNQDSKIPAFVNWGGGTPGMWMTGGFDPVLFATKHLWTMSNNVSKVVGTHTMKFGGYFGYVTNAQPGEANSNGSFVYANYSPNSTGNALADLLTGRIESYTSTTRNVVRDQAFRDLSFFAQDSWKVTRRLTLDYGMRFQNMRPWQARNEFGIAAWYPEQYSNDPARMGDLTGLDWHGRNPSVSRSGWDSRPIFFAPRFGMAYDLFGTGATVIRGGWGRFVYFDPQLAAGAMDVPGGFRSTNVCCGINLRDVASFQPAVVRTGATAVDPRDDQQPTTDSWSFTVSQRAPWRSLLEVSYVGNDSKNLINAGYGNMNLVPRGAMLNDPDGNANDYRPLQNYFDVNVASHQLHQNYHGLQTSWMKQTGPMNFTVAYTWSKAMGIRGGGQGQRGDELDFRNNYGPLAYDRTHVFVTSYVFDLPAFSRMTGSNSRAFRAIADEWQISGITQLQSGVNLQAANGNPNFNFSAPRSATDSRGISAALINGTPAISAMPMVTCDPRSGLQDGQFINGGCFAAPSPGNNGALILPYMRGPAFLNNDLSLFKNFSLSETRRLQFRFSGYNWVNHPVRTFTNGDQNLNLTLNAPGQLVNPRFGFADNRIGRRIIQLGVKFYF